MNKPTLKQILRELASGQKDISTICNNAKISWRDHRKEVVDIMLALEGKGYIKQTELGKTYIITDKGLETLNRLSRENIIKFRR